MVFADNPNRDELNPNMNLPSDIRLNVWEYHDMLDALLDDKISAEGLVKMKQLYWQNSIAMIAVPIVSFPLAWVCNKWLQGT